MILRKPYAFLMKHFKKINLALFILTLYVFVKTLTLLGYTKEYASGNTVIVNTITSFFTGSYFFVHILILMLGGILLYLLKRKDKPIKTYMLILVEYFIFFILSIYLNGYFGDFYINGYDKAFARTINGLVFIFSLPQYLILLLLFIRFIGLDLKSFGFQNDKEFITSEEDREEVEVEVGLNSHIIKRKTKKVFREILYFIKEHKIRLAIISLIVLIPTGVSLYKTIYLPNRIFKTGDIVSSNYYEFKVNNTYITTRNYRGDIINKERSYIVLDLDVTNLVSSSRILNIEGFSLLVDGISYNPTVNYNEQFEDLGNTFKKQNLKGNSTSNYFLIFEIKNPKKDSNFILRYQDITSHSKLIRIKLTIKDISSFVVKDTKRITEEQTVKINQNKTTNFTINNYEIGNSFLYTYEACNYTECYIKEGYANSSLGKKVLYMRVSSSNTTYETLQDFIRYGKIRYVVNGKAYEEKLKSNVTKKYRGNYLYFDVNEKIVNASSIELILTVRNNQYIYIIK